MGQFRRFLGASLMILALIFITGFSNNRPALAQAEEPIVAGVDRLELSTDEMVTLTVVVDVSQSKSSTARTSGAGGLFHRRQQHVDADEHHQRRHQQQYRLQLPLAAVSHRHAHH